MSCSTVLFSLFMLSPCADGGGEDVNEAVAAAVADNNRPAADVAADASRHPGQVLAFLNIKPGMTVLDLFSGSGYYTEMLHTVVGENGRVIAHTNQAYIPYVGEIYVTRYKDNRLPNAEVIVAEADDIELKADSLDAAMLILTWHDFLYADEENGWASIDEMLLVDKLCDAMKPGAVLGLIDHAADSGGDAAVVGQTLHRVDPQVVRDAFDETCFTLEAEADFLRNPEDDHSLPMGNPKVRGKTDRFVFKFVRN